MFQYTNTIILNSSKDSSGLDKWKAENGVLDVKRVMKFKKANVLSIYKTGAKAATMSNVKFTMQDFGEGLYRIVLYMGLQNNNNSYYSNDMVFKGKPLVYEFSVSATAHAATDMAKAAEASINKIMSLFGDRYITVKASSAELNITGTDEYQIFKVAKLQKFNPTANTALVGGIFEDKIVATEGGTSDKITNGTPGFGTYSLIIKDLRLPTMEAIRFGGINQEELPIIGATYNQYTIHYLSDRYVAGSDAVGQEVQSQTTHVFYVKSDVVSAFETALGEIGTIDAEVSRTALTSSSLGDGLEMDDDKLTIKLDGASLTKSASGLKTT